MMTFGAMTAEPAAAQTAPPQLTAGPIPSTLGINVKWDWYPIDRLNSELPTHVSLLKDLGVGWVRMGMIWEFNERQRGVYDFSRQDAVVDALGAAGIGVLFILAYDNPLYDGGMSPYTDEGRQGFVNFSKAAVQRYVGKKVAWEIYNEPNWGNFWSPSPNLHNYLKLAEALTPELRAIAPSQAILGPSISGPNVHGDCTVGDGFIGAVLEHPVSESWSGISVHPYRKTTVPEEMLPEMDALQCEIDSWRFGLPRQPSVITEFGYSTYNGDKGVNEEQQASYLLRFYFSSLSRQIPLAMIYDWQDDGTDVADEEHKYGILRYGTPNPGNPGFYKPSYTALKRVNQHLAGYRFEANLALVPGAMGVQLLKGTRTRAFVTWSSDNYSHGVTLPLKKGTWQATDLVTGSQSTIQVPTRSGGASVTTGAHPVLYVRIGGL
jgi:hypothetical protein